MQTKSADQTLPGGDLRTNPAGKLTLSELQEFMKQIPFNELLGLRVAELHADGLTIECDFRPDLRNGFGTLHGGVTATLADVAAGIATSYMAGSPRSATTVDMKVNYLRPVTEGRISARAVVLRFGSTLSVCRVDLNDEQDRLFAAAMVTYLILKPE